MRQSSLMTSRLDRIVELQARRVTRDSFGSEIEGWSEIDKVWANVNQTGVSENFENESNRAVALRNSTIRILWRSDVQETSRVVYDDLAWDIKGISEIGFRRELELILSDGRSPARGNVLLRLLTPAASFGALAHWLLGAAVLRSFGGVSSGGWRDIYVQSWGRPHFKASSGASQRATSAWMLCGMPRNDRRSIDKDGRCLRRGWSGGPKWLTLLTWHPLQP